MYIFRLRRWYYLPSDPEVVCVTGLPARTAKTFVPFFYLGIFSLSCTSNPHSAQVLPTRYSRGLATAASSRPLAPSAPGASSPPFPLSLFLLSRAKSSKSINQNHLTLRSISRNSLYLSYGQQRAQCADVFESRLRLLGRFRCVPLGGSRRHGREKSIRKHLILCGTQKNAFIPPGVYEFTLTYLESIHSSKSRRAISAFFGMSQILDIRLKCMRAIAARRRQHPPALSA